MTANFMQRFLRNLLAFLKAKPVIGNSLLAAVSLIGILGCLELGFRVYIVNAHPELAQIIKQFTWEAANETTRQRFKPHPYLSYAPSRIAYTDGGIQIGAEEFAVEKPADTLRIACLGASTTMNQYPRYLEEHLAAEIAGPYAYEVMDFGCDGWTLTESTINYLLRVQDFQPDYVIVHHGMNDLAGRIWPNYKPDYTHYRKSYHEPLLGYLSREYLSFSWMVTYLLFKAGVSSIDIMNLTTHLLPHDQLLKEPPSKTIEAFLRNLKSLHTLVTANDGELIYAPMAYNAEKAEFYDPQLIREFNQAGKALATEQGIAVAETQPLLQNHPDWFKDIVHVTELGNQLKAQIYSQKIAESMNGKQ